MSCCNGVRWRPNILLMFSIARLLSAVFEQNAGPSVFLSTAVIVLCVLLIRYLATVVASRMSFLSSKAVKKTLREKIYQKLLKLGSSYSEKVRTSEIVQVAVEGVDQLETYFGCLPAAVLLCDAGTADALSGCCALSTSPVPSSCWSAFR